MLYSVNDKQNFFSINNYILTYQLIKIGFVLWRLTCCYWLFHLFGYILQHGIIESKVLTGLKRNRLISSFSLVCKILPRLLLFQSYYRHHSALKHTNPTHYFCWILPCYSDVPILLFNFRSVIFNLVILCAWIASIYMDILKLYSSINTHVWVREKCSVQWISNKRLDGRHWRKNNLDNLGRFELRDGSEMERVWMDFCSSSKL